MDSTVHECMKSTGYEAASCVMLSIALSVVCLSLLASKGLAFIREIRNIFILLAEKFKRISNVERNKLDLKEIRCEV
jgi:TRAP-type C4-dicarboxylate transport system permease small subunit